MGYEQSFKALSSNFRLFEHFVLQQGLHEVIKTLKIA